MATATWPFFPWRAFSLIFAHFNLKLETHENNLTIIIERRVQCVSPWGFQARMMSRWCHDSYRYLGLRHSSRWEESLVLSVFYFVYVYSSREALEFILLFGFSSGTWVSRDSVPKAIDSCFIGMQTCFVSRPLPLVLMSSLHSASTSQVHSKHSNSVCQVSWITMWMSLQRCCS